MSATTIRVQQEQLDSLYDLQEQMYPETHEHVPLNATIDVLVRDKLTELNRGDNE